MWVRKLFRERKTKEAFNLFIKDMQLFDHEYFFKFFRMKPTKYKHLLSQLHQRLQNLPSDAKQLEQVND